jgi:hypothetical protein
LQLLFQMHLEAQKKETEYILAKEHKLRMDVSGPF